MNNKQKYLILLCAMVLIALCFFYFTSNMISEKQDKIKRYDRRIKVEQEKLNSAKVLNEQLQHVSLVIKNTPISPVEVT